MGKQFKNLSPQFYIANKVELIVGLTRSYIEMKNDKPVCVSVISNDQWRKRKRLGLICVLIILLVIAIFEIVCRFVQKPKNSFLLLSKANEALTVTYFDPSLNLPNLKFSSWIREILFIFLSGCF